MRLSRCEVRDHINYRKNDRWRSHRFYRALQRLKSPLRYICEIFGAPNIRVFQHNLPRAVIPEPLRSSRSFQDAQRSAGEPGIHPSAARPLRGPRAPKQRPLLRATAACGHLRRRRNGHRSFIDLAPPAVGQQSLRATVRPACGPSTRRRELLSRASPSGTRSRSGGAPLPRPAPWRAA